MGSWFFRGEVCSSDEKMLIVIAYSQYDFVFSATGFNSEDLLCPLCRKDRVYESTTDSGAERVYRL